MKLSGWLQAGRLLGEMALGHPLEPSYLDAMAM